MLYLLGPETQSKKCSVPVVAKRAFESREYPSKLGRGREASEQPCVNLTSGALPPAFLAGVCEAHGRWTPPDTQTYMLL